MNAQCFKCESNKPYTTADGGATSIFSCRASANACLPGEGLLSTSDKVCSNCLQGYYSTGGTNAVCSKCPTDAPYSEKNNRTSKSSCKVSAKFCSNGKALPATPYKLVASGNCKYPITTYEECVKASKALNMGSDVVESSSASSYYPKGCYGYWQ